MQKSVIEWIKPLLKSGKNLVYFASGTYVNPEYKKLKYENVFLIDYCFRQNSYDGEKIFCLKLDNIEAVNLFRVLEIKIHFFVGLNEGLNEGGGRYPINSDSFIGYCFPLFTDRLLHIGCKDYYHGTEFAHLRQHFLDLPFQEKLELTNDSQDYISPSHFSNLGQRATLIALNKKVKRIHKISSSLIDIYVEHNSVWSAKDELDAIFTRFDTEFQKIMIQKFNKNVFPIKSYSMYEPQYKTYDTNEIIELCQNNKFRKIGLVPNGMNYTNQIKLFEQQANGFPKVIRYFHLNKDDFKGLYNKNGG
jgi:hypothetical protein